MLDAFLDDGFLIPTFEQLAALQIDYEGRVLEAHCSLRVLCILGKNIRGGLGGPGLGGKGCFLHHSIPTGSPSWLNRTCNPIDKQLLGYSLVAWNWVGWGGVGVGILMLLCYVNCDLATC